MTSRSRSHAKQWRQLLEQVYAEESHCWRCGEWVDQSIPGTRPHGDTFKRNMDSKSGGHIYPHSTHPLLRLARENVHLEHLGCNMAAQAKQPPAPTSKQW